MIDIETENQKIALVLLGLILMLVTFCWNHFAPVVPMDYSLESSTGRITLLDPNPSIVPRERFLEMAGNNIIAISTANGNTVKTLYYTQSETSGNYDIACEEYVQPPSRWHSLFYCVGKLTVSEVSFNPPKIAGFLLPLIGLVLFAGALIYSPGKS